MSKKNMFDTAAEERKKEQAEITAAVTGRGRGRPKKEDNTITNDTSTPDKITLSISAENKLRIKRYALEHGTTVSDLVQEWILTYC